MLYYYTMENEAYIQRQDEELAAYEAVCTCCGICCGAQDNDPCVHLKSRDDGKYYCDTYVNRFGLQKTISGKEFTCVMIRDVLKFGVHYEGCGYNA